MRSQLPAHDRAFQSSQIVDQVEQQFGLQVRDFDVVKTSTRNHLYKLWGEGRNVFLKLRLDSFSRDRVAEEAALVAYLNDADFNAPTLVKNLSGGNVFECTLNGDRVCGYLTEELQIERPGIDVDDEVHLTLAARKLAEFHTRTGALAGDFTVVNWSHHWLIDRNLQVIEPLFAERRGDFEVLCSSFDRVRTHVSRTWSKTAGTWGIIHGDWHAANVVIGADADLWFLDFESFGNGWRIHDVLYLLGSTKGGSDLPLLRDRWEVFMTEYSKGGPALGNASEFPTFWLAVRQLLVLGRQIEASGESGFDPSRADVWIDGLAEEVHGLTQHC